LDKVRVAIVGCGYISVRNVPGYLQQDRCEVVALCDPIEELAQARAREWRIDPKIYTSYEDVLNDSAIDAVELLTPSQMHARQSIDALDAGKHVSSQKPVGVNVAETEELIAAVSRAKTKFRVTENFLYYPPLVKATELLEGGAIGEPSMVRIHTVRGFRPGSAPRGPGPAPMTWRQDRIVLPGGTLYDDGWHKFATAMAWIGEVEGVYAMLPNSDDPLVETPSAIMWRFRDKDCLATFDFVNASEMPLRTLYTAGDEFFEIVGSKGAIWVTRCTGEWLDMPPVILLKGTETTSFQLPMDTLLGFNGAAKAFIDCILTDRQPDLDVHFSKRVLQSILAAYESSKSKREVDPNTIN
jgi:predicted dehydrogenase